MRFLIPILMTAFTVLLVNAATFRVPQLRALQKVDSI